ncbi:MAG: hypothetical protein ACRC7N_14895 [Clostridium sp.]
MIKLVHTTTKKGRMILRGNTMGISNGAGDCCRQYASISLDPSLSAGAGYPSCTSTTLPGCPFGTTLDWTQNGSFSDIELYPNETVEYAFLLWAMSSVGGLADNSIKFNTPTQGVNISPDPAYSLGVSDGFISYTTRGANVTSYVKEGGRYSVEGIPTPSPSTNVGTGWCLALIINNSSLPVKNMSIYAVSEVNFPNDVAVVITGFKSPLIGPVEASVYVSAQWGDAIAGADTFLLNGVTLSGPKNPEPNFFQGQIVDENGDYYNSSMNNYNAVPSIPSGTGGPYIRQDYDITTIKTTGVIAPGSTSATVNVAKSSSDTVTVNFLGLEVDALAAIVESSKSINKALSFPGDTIIYTVVLRNTGTQTAINIKFNDTIPQNTTFINNSLSVNGIQQLGSGLFNVTVPDLVINALATISFSVLVSNTIVSPITISNSSFSTYSSNGDTVVEVSTSNTVDTPIILQPNLSGISKSASKLYASLNDSIIYTIVIPNNSSITAKNVVLKDTIPSGINYQGGSITINGVPSPTADIQAGINLGDIQGGFVSTVTFLATVTTIAGTIINTANVTYEDPVTIGKTYYNESADVVTTVPNVIMSSVKLATPTISGIGTTINYIITIKNDGNIQGEVYLLDTIPTGFKLINNSLKQDGNTISNTGNISVTLPGIIMPNELSTITFDVYVESLPSPNPFNNIANLQTEYVFDPSTLPIIKKISSINSTNVSVLINNATLTVMKYVDKEYVTFGDLVEYTILCKNTGNIPANNIIFIDTISNGLSYVTDSLKINGVIQFGANPNSGVNLPDIAGNEVMTITFFAKI